jgi:glycolate oxidase
MKVTSDEFERKMYTHDVAPLPKPMELIFNTMPDFVVRPENVAEVRKVVKLAIRRKIPIIPRGGASWAMMGAVPVRGGIVVDMTGMNRVLDIDEENLSVTVEAGATWKKLYDLMWEKGFLIGAYPSSAPTATIGGWINVGGVGVCSYKYGGVGDQLRSIQVVLPTGEVIETGFGGVVSNQSGYDLRNLIVGSEGTLGIVTKATIKLHPKPEVLRTLFYSFADLKQASVALLKLTRAKITPLHIGFADGKHFEFVRAAGVEAPEVGGMLNVALEGDKKAVEYEESVVDSIMTTNGGKKESDELAEHEWHERFYHFRARRLGPGLIPGDAYVPVAKFAEMVDGTYKITEDLKMKAAIVGTVADRNTVGFMPYYITDETKIIRSTLSMGFAKKLFDLAFKVGGRPAGGLGLFFSCNLKKMHGEFVNAIPDVMKMLFGPTMLNESSDASVDLMRRIKETLDPHNIMNPGKTIETMTRFGIPVPALAMSIGLDAMAMGKKILPRDK